MLGQDEVKEGIILIVGAGRSIRGTVRGLRAEQLQTAHILLRSESEVAFFSARPDEWGAYALNGVPPGHAVMTVFSAGLQFEKQVDVPADQDVTLDIVFPTGARLVGPCNPGRQTGCEQECLDDDRSTTSPTRSIARGHRKTGITRSKGCLRATIA